LAASALAASALDFTDTLPAALAVANPANAATTCTGGTLTATPGASVIGYSGGTVAAGASCTVQVDVVGAAAGVHVNTSGALTSSSGSSGTASATLNVQALPVFSKGFDPAAIPMGGVSTLSFTIDNSANTLAADALDFTDTLPNNIVVADPPNAVTTCSGGTLTATAGAAVIGYSGGSVSAGASCTVQADVTAAAAGTFVNTSGDLTSSLGNSGSASATLEVVALENLVLTKSFSGGSVQPGGIAALLFTLSNPNAFAATGIIFTDDLDAVIAGLQAIDLPQTDMCGAGSSLSGTSLLTFAGGSLAAGALCTFTVNLSVPDDAGLGIFINTTSTVSAAVKGISVGGAAASASLSVAPPPIPVPTLGVRQLLLLSGLLLLLALVCLRRSDA
jgi:hypothetical protein